MQFPWAIGRADLELRNTIVAAVVLPVAFLIGVQWELYGLAFSWAVAAPLVFMLNFPRTSRALGLDLASIGRAIRAPLLAGVAMHAVVSGARVAMATQEEIFRLPLLIIAGAVAYVAVVSVLDRGVWADMRRVASAMRG